MHYKRSLGLTFLVPLFFFASATACLKAKVTDQKVDVGGLELGYRCLGDGRPVVVIAPGGGDPGRSWLELLPRIAELTRVCVYSRAGLGASDPLPPDPRTVRNVVDELQALLVNAGIQGPYVLVGHSLGGLHVRSYAARFPDEVVGMVLVDTTHEKHFALMDALTPPAVKDFQDKRKKMKPHPPLEGISDFDAYLGADADLPRLGEIPLIVMGSTREPDLSKWRARMPKEIKELYELSREEIDNYRAGANALGEHLVRVQALLSAQGRYVEVQDAGHFIHNDRPDLVLEAILEVVEMARR